MDNDYQNYIFLSMRITNMRQHCVIHTPHKNVNNTTAICHTFGKCGPRSLAVNRRAVLANKCVGGSYASLESHFVLLDIPPPVSQCTYQQHMKVVAMRVAAEIEESTRRAREEVRDLYGDPPDQVIDILISCDGTW